MLMILEILLDNECITHIIRWEKLQAGRLSNTKLLHQISGFLSIYYILLALFSSYLKLILSMESLRWPTIDCRWLLCTLVTLFGYLLISYTFPGASRLSFCIPSSVFSGLQAKHLDSGAHTSSIAVGSVSISSPSPQPHACNVESAPMPCVTDIEIAPSPSIEELQLQNDEITKSSFSEANTVMHDNSKEEVEKCDIFQGRWVYDTQTYLPYRDHQCPFLSDQVSCQRNGRPDSNYQNWRWQPNSCNLPRFDGRRVLEEWRGKRVVIIGDSLNRNMWESLACLLSSSLSPRRTSIKLRRSESKVFKAIDYNCTVEFYWSPFLVELKKSKDGSVILRLNKISGAAQQWNGADVMVFNTGHWWTHRGKMRSWNYFEQHGKLIEDMKQEEAFEEALRTWARWIESNVHPNKTTVFFRSISPEHKRENLHWCYNQSHPITNETYLQWFPKIMTSLVEETIRKIKTPVRYLNITKLSEYRRDAHTAVYTSRKGKLLTAEQRDQPAQYADCSHWCLPGLPDTWNILLIASLKGTSSTIP